MGACTGGHGLGKSRRPLWPSRTGSRRQRPRPPGLRASRTLRQTRGRHSFDLRKQRLTCDSATCHPHSSGPGPSHIPALRQLTLTQAGITARSCERVFLPTGSGWAEGPWGISLAAQALEWVREQSSLTRRPLPTHGWDARQTWLGSTGSTPAALGPPQDQRPQESLAQQVTRGRAAHVDRPELRGSGLELGSPHGIAAADLEVGRRPLALSGTREPGPAALLGPRLWSSGALPPGRSRDSPNKRERRPEGRERPGLPVPTERAGPGAGRTGDG